jgi:hypothetical protein
MKRMFVVGGMAIILSASWLIKTRHTPRAVSGSESHASSSISEISEAEFRQKIRTIIQKVASDVKKEQALANANAPAPKAPLN